MTTEILRRYLNDFYNGTSTPQQEHELRQFFLSTDDVDEEFRADAVMFRAMSGSTTPHNLEERILKATVKRPRIRRLLPLPYIAAAAAIALIILTTPAKGTDNYREVTDPAEAETITIQVAQTLQKSVNKLEILNNLPL